MWSFTSSLHRSMPGLLVLYSSRVCASFKGAILACMSLSSLRMSSVSSFISSRVCQMGQIWRTKPTSPKATCKRWTLIKQITLFICHWSSWWACSSWWVRFRKANRVATRWDSNSFRTCGTADVRFKHLARIVLIRHSTDGIPMIES